MFKLLTIFVVFCIVSPLIGETIRIDVTGDGVNDEVKISEKAVIVNDGASKKKTVIHKETDTEWETNTITDCMIIHLGSKNGIKVEVYSYGEGAAHGNISDVIYLYKNNSFKEIPAPGSLIVETVLSHPKLDIIYLAIDRLGIVENFLYWDGEQFNEMSKKDAKVCRQQLEAEIINNMHCVQLAVEDYSTIHDGVYPQSVSEFKDLLPSTIANPVNPDAEFVIDAFSGQQPGQVMYECISGSNHYRITAIGIDGEQMSKELTGEF